MVLLVCDQGNPEKANAIAKYFGAEITGLCFL